MATIPLLVSVLVNSRDEWGVRQTGKVTLGISVLLLCRMPRLGKANFISYTKATLYLFMQETSGILISNVKYDDFYMLENPLNNSEMKPWAKMTTKQQQNLLQSLILPIGLQGAALCETAGIRIESCFQRGSPGF